MGKTIRVIATVDIPRPPNFLRMLDGQTLPVGGASDESLREIGKAWTEALLARAAEQRAEWRATRTEPNEP